MVVAINNPVRSRQNGDSTDFYRVETWGKLAELAGKYLNKGNQVGVSGRLILDHWTDKQGQSRITPIVQATQMALPPRFKAVLEDDQSAEPAVEANPIGGEMVFSNEDGEDVFPLTKETTYGGPITAQPEANTYSNAQKVRIA